ncbi:MAG TPA: protein kinase [Gemmatimonadales bacterium]|nr:protein kinase [Gemmatimonadales bacterium]
MILSGRYRVDRELGSGGMATVYLAHDLKHQRTVAVKVLRPELAASLGTDRFLREIEITAGLDHPHILPVHDSGEADGSLYYVMPYVEGESLRDRMTREGQLPVEDAVRIAREVADALATAHRRNIVHRDIKPENILLSENHARVADFGIARAITEAGGARLTSAGMAIGTPAYMSPEQAMGSEQIDGRSDIYALGCVLYEMLAGEPPYSGATAQSILVKRLTEPVPRLSALRESVSPGLNALVHRALSKAPADRPSTAEAFVEALDRSASASIPSSAPRRYALIAASLLVVVVALVLIGLRLREAKSAIAARRPSDAGASHLARGDNLLKLRTPEAFASAITEYETAFGQDSTNAETLARIGYAHALFADWGWSYHGLTMSALRARALEYSERAIAADSSSAAAWLARAYALVQLDPYRMRGAVEAFERSLGIDSTRAEAWYQFGQALMYLGRDSAAEGAYRRAFRLDRERPMSLMSLAAILRKNGRLDEARRLIDTAIFASRTVSSPYVRVLRGIMALDAGDVGLAGDEARLALELDTSYAIPARSLLVRVRVAEGNRAAASAELNHLLRVVTPEETPPTEALFASGALLALGRQREVLEILERSKPRGAQLWFYLRNPEFNPLRANPRFVRIERDADPRDSSDQNPP